MADTIKFFGKEYTNTIGVKFPNGQGDLLTFIRPQGTKLITENGTGIDVTSYAAVDVNVSGGSGGGVYQSKTINPSESQQNVTPDSGYDALSGVTVTAIASDYIGSAIPTRSGADLNVSGANVTVPSGFYGAQVSAAVANGTEGTPIATKGTVSNHSVTVTPSVTNTAGYIAGGTKSGTGVNVTASELVSGTKSITENGTGIDVTNYASVDVSVVVIPTKTITITNGGSNYSYIKYNDIIYYRSGDTIQVNENSTILITVAYGDSNYIYVNGVVVAGGGRQTVNEYEYTVTTDIEISFSESMGTSTARITELNEIMPLEIIQNGTYTASGSVKGYSPVTVDVPLPSYQAKTISPSETAQTIIPDTGYDALSQVSISAVSSTYVGSGITRRSSTDLTASTSTITAPAGYYASAASKTVSAGTAGTPTATKGTVFNHSISITPSVMNTTGWITGSTKTGTAVTVSASELVSGTSTISANGTGIDVTNYASVNVAVPTPAPNLQWKSVNYTPATTSKSYAVSPDAGYDGMDVVYVFIDPMPSGTEGTPIAAKGTVSNHSVTITPSVTNTAGYISGSTKSGTAVTVSASELVSGSETKTSNGTYDVTNLASLVVAIPIVTYYTGSSTPSSSTGQNGDIYLQTS